MSGQLVPEVACDACPTRERADVETTLQALRRRLRSYGWARHRAGGGAVSGLVDLCPECERTSRPPRRREIDGQLSIDDALEVER